MLEGGCFCGYVRYRTSANPFHETHCHCSICRRTSAAPIVPWFSVPAKELIFTAGEPARFQSSDHGTRSFCPQCGTPLTFQTSQAAAEIDVTICSLDDPEAVVPKDHSYVRSKLSWIKLADDLPAFATTRRES
jgi:hypothetical protein